MNLRTLFVCLNVVMLGLFFNHAQGMVHGDDLVRQLFSPATITDKKAQELLMGAKVIFDKGDYAKAQQCADIVIGQSLSSGWKEEARYFAARCAYYQKHYVEAIRYLDSLEYSNVFVAVKYLRAGALMALGELELASKLFREVIFELGEPCEDYEKNLYKNSLILLKKITGTQLKCIDPWFLSNRF